MEDIEKLKLEVLETPFSGDVKEKFCRALEVSSEEADAFTESERLNYEADMSFYFKAMDMWREILKERKKKDLWDNMSEETKKWVEDVKIGILLKNEGFSAEEIAERVQVDIKHVNRFVMKEAKTFMKVYER